MNFKTLGALIALSSLLAACASAPPKLNSTSVKTNFDLLASPEGEEEFWLKDGAKFLEREVKLGSAAKLTSDVTIQVGKKTKTLAAGTYLFGSSTPVNMKRPDLNGLLKFMRDDEPALFQEFIAASTASTDDRKSKTAAVLQKAMNAFKLKNGIVDFQVYCALSKSALTVDEFTSAILTLGLTLGRKKDDVYCFQDKDSDGMLDTYWESQLTYSYPPTIDQVYNDAAISPTSFETIDKDSIESIGTLWVEIDINRKGTKATINGKIGNDKKSIEFDNLRHTVTENNMGYFRKFFGAEYKVVELSSNGQARIAVKRSKQTNSISLSKRVTYSTRTTYIPIYVP